MCVYARVTLLTINKGVALLSVMNTNKQIRKLSQIKKHNYTNIHAEIQRGLLTRVRHCFGFAGDGFSEKSRGVAKSVRQKSKFQQISD